MRYALKYKDGAIAKGVGWSSKADAEKWIQEHIAIFGGLDWRVGGLFKPRTGCQLEVVWSKSKKSVDWTNVKPSP